MIVRITMYKHVFSKRYTKKWLTEIFVIDYMLKTNLWTYKIKDLNGKKIMGSSYQKQLFLSKL